MWYNERIKLSHWIYFTIHQQRILASTIEERDLASLPRAVLKRKDQSTLYYIIVY